MGHFLSTLAQFRQNIHQHPNTKHLNVKLEILKQQFSSFKSICDDLSLDSFTYSEIFEGDFNSFKIWDTDKTGKIDALELFTGLILSSAGKFKEKVQFLFEMFDLNEESALTYQCLQFMLINCCNATIKMFEIKVDLYEQELEQFLNEYFCLDSNITLKQLIVWSVRAKEVISYFEIIGQKTIEKQDSLQLVNITQIEHNDRSRCILKPPFFNTYRKELQDDYSSISIVHPYLTQPDFSQPIEEFHPINEWVFGIRMDDIRQPMNCVVNTGQQAANQKLLYFVGCVVVIYFPKLGTQSYYFNHKKQISCLTISQSGTIIATGQHGDQPQIHIWDTKTRQTIRILQEIHQKSIVALEFVCNDAFLVSASEYCEGYAFVVQNVSNGNLLFSGRIDDYLIKIIENRFQDNQNVFTIVCAKSINHFRFSDEAFMKIVKPIQNQQEQFTDALYLYENAWTIVLATSLGNIYFCGADSSNTIDLDEGIVSIKTINGVLYALSQATLYTIDVKEKLVKKTNLAVVLQGLSAIQLASSDKRLYILCELGLLISYDIKTGQIKKCPHLFKLQNPKSVCTVERTNQLYYCSGKLIWVIDMESKELKKITSTTVNIQVLRVAQDGTMLVGNQLCQLLVYRDTKEVPTVAQLDSTVLDIVTTKKQELLFSIVVLTENSIVFMDYETLDVKTRFALQSIKLQRIIKTSQNGLLLAITKGKDPKLYKIDPDGLKLNDGHKKSEHIIAKVEQKFILMHPNKSILIVSGRKGKIHFWNDYSRAKAGKELYEQLSGHASEIFELVEHNSFGGFISVGKSDQMMSLWSGVGQHQRNVQCLKNAPEEKVLQGEFYAGLELEESPEQLRDSFAAIKSVTDKCHNEIIQQILLPNSVKYQPLVDKEKSPNLMKLAPLLSMKLSRVLGFQCANTRNSLFYCHSYKSIGQNMGNLPLNTLGRAKQVKKISKEVKEEIVYSKQTLIPYIQTHHECNKMFVYFVDRICIVYTMENKQQRFYEHHKNKVTAIGIHPNKNLVCSVESPSLTNDSLSTIVNKAKIHIWNSVTLRKQIVLEHFNSGIVNRVVFSRNGKYLATLTKINKEEFSSIQIYDWRNNLFVAQRVFPQQMLTDLEFDPHKPNKLVVVGVGMIAILEIVNTVLVVREKHCHSDKETITCLVHAYNCYGDVIESDVITGNSTGDISLLICGKYIKTKENAHNGMINCLRIGELFQYMVVIITGGEDKFVKIWNTKMCVMASIYLRDLPCFGDNLSSSSKHYNYAPQSMDLYNCFPDKKHAKEPRTDILIGTRGGDIIELSVRNEFHQLKPTKRNAVEIQPNRERRGDNVIVYDSRLYLRDASSENMSGFIIYKDLMFTFSEKEYIYLWDLVKMELVHTHNLKQKPSTMKFSNSGQIVAVGFYNGDVKLYQVNTKKELILLQLINNPGNLVLSIVFSMSDKKVAISLYNPKPMREPGSEIHVYAMKTGSKEIPSVHNEFQIKNQITNRVTPKSHGVFFMDFSSDEMILLLHYQDVKNNRRVKLDRQNKFYLWNLDSNKQLSTSEQGVEFDHINFCNLVNVTYNYRQIANNIASPESVQTEVLQMTQHENYICLGMANGEVIISQASAFFHEGVSLGRIYRAHVSGVEFMKVSQGYLYTAGPKNKSVMCWKLQEQKQAWDYDTANILVQDKYCDTYSNERLSKYFNDVFPRRKNIPEVQESKKDEGKITTKIKLNKILGRNAFYKRNNLFYDFNDSIITYSGCNILVMNQAYSLGLEQKVAQLDRELVLSLPEISAMGISSDRKFLTVGTFSEEAHIFIWDISSETTIFQLRLMDIVEIHHLQFSQNSKYIVATGLSLQNTLVLFLVDVKKEQVIACHDFTYSTNTKIHDLIFLPEEETKFVTCGLHHVAGWNYSCGLFSYDVYQVETQETLEGKNNQPVNFYNMIFVKDILVTAAADGYIYIWKEKKSVKRQSAHPDSSVLTLHTTTGSEIFASGGTDGKVIFWLLSVNVVQKLSEFQVYPFKKEVTMSAKYHVQSIFIGREKIVVGTRSGDVYEFDKPRQITGKSDNKSRKLVLPSFNHEKVVSICFSSSSRWFYVLTQKGCFEIYELETLNKIYSKYLYSNVQAHKMKSILKMFVCMQTDIVFVICKEEVQVYQFRKDTIARGNSQSKDGNQSLVKISSTASKQTRQAVLSPNQRYLALLINSQQSVKIIIYYFPKLPKQAPRDWYRKFDNFQSKDNLSAQIQFLDFSTDSNYLLIANSDSSYIALQMNNKEIDINKQEHKIQWAGEGKLILESIKDVTSYYSNSNQLLQVTQIMNKCVVVTDEMGSLRVFGYPAKGYFDAQFYHLNNISICKVSPDSKTLITMSEYDRAIHIWNIQDEEQELLVRKGTLPSIFDTN